MTDRIRRGSRRSTTTRTSTSSDWVSPTSDWCVDSMKTSKSAFGGPTAGLMSSAPPAGLVIGTHSIQSPAVSHAAAISGDRATQHSRSIPGRPSSPRSGLLMARTGNASASLAVLCPDNRTQASSPVPLPRYMGRPRAWRQALDRQARNTRTTFRVALARKRWKTALRVAAVILFAATSTPRLSWPGDFESGVTPSGSTAPAAM